MGKALDFIKTHLVSLLCAVAAIGFIVVGVMGMTSKKVTDDMKKALTDSGGAKIKGLMSSPKNQEIIDKEQQRVKSLEEEYTKAKEVAAKINRREPLMEGVFPKPETSATPYKYREVYQEAYKRLPQKLEAGTLPTEEDIAEEQQNVIDLLELEKERADETVVEDNDRAPAVSRVTGRGRVPSGRSAGGRFGGGGEGGGRFAGGGFGEGGGRFAGGGFGQGSGRFGEGGGRFGGAGQASVQIDQNAEPKYNPLIRARVSKAKEIRCYYDPQTFHASPLLDVASTAPTTDDMWFGQVAWWVMDDVAGAIAGLNKEFADKLTDTDASVENVPVKRLVALDVYGYVTDKGLVEFPNRNLNTGRSVLPPGAKSFTKRKSNEQFDVVKFGLTVVVDQRYLNLLIDAISRANFFQCVNLSYQAVDRNAEENALGYYYGPAPVVLASMEFEAYMGRDVYLEMMPDSVRTLLGINKREGD